MICICREHNIKVRDRKRKLSYIETERHKSSHSDISYLFIELKDLFSIFIIILQKIKSLYILQIYLFFFLFAVDVAASGIVKGKDTDCAIISLFYVIWMVMRCRIK